MEYTTLNNGLKMPLMGFGVYQISDSNEAVESVKSAIKHGYTLIDTAAAYQNEEEVGQAIKESDVNREDLFITTKLWIQDTGYESTKEAFHKSLNRLGLDYIHLYLIHQPFGDVHGSWRAMEELYEEGKVKAIGVSNFSEDRLMDLIQFNKIKPMVNQIEVNPFYQQHDKDEFHKGQDVHTEAWAPFAEGKNNLFQNETIVKIAEKYNKSVAQVVVRWLIQRDITVLAKSVNEDRIQQNIDVFDFELSDEDVATIEKLDTKESQFLDHRNPETVEQLTNVRFDI